MDTRKVINSSNPQVEVTWAETEQERVAARKLTRVQNDCLIKECRAAIARWEGEIVGALWLAGKSFAEPDLGLSIQLEPRQSWLFSAFVHHEYRRQGIYTELLKFVLQQSRANDPGVEILLAINPANRRSRIAHEASGLQLVARALVVRCLNMAWGGGKWLISPDRLTLRPSWTWNHRIRPVQIHLKPGLSVARET